MKPKWHYPVVRQDDIQGSGLAEQNFTPEDRTSEEILVRESLQNPCDAGSSSGIGTIEVRMRLLDPSQIDTGYLGEILGPDYLTRLAESTDDPPTLDFGGSGLLLVIEDFGTTGLLGDCHNSLTDGSGENWNAFWFRVGQGAKSGTGSNGRAGQGKVTYYASSSVRVVLGLTIRDSDSAELLMGRSSLRRDYRFGGKKYKKDAFWCLTGDDDRVLPIEDRAEIERFKKAFCIERASEPGLSLVVPFPKGFRLEDALVTVISEYYYPIVKGRLVVRIGQQEINRSNIDDIANKHLNDDILAKKKSSFTEGFRGFVRTIVEEPADVVGVVGLKSGWEKKTALTGDDFSEGLLENLKTSLARGERISVRCPIKIKPKKGAAIESFFYVHLQVPDGLERCEEAYIRRDLLIGGERHLSSGGLFQNARGLTDIQDDDLSALMAEAEEPTHLRWNASRRSPESKYQVSSDVVRAVRLALPRLLACLGGGGTKKDKKVLVKFFSRPSAEAPGRNGKKHNQKAKGGEPVEQPVVVLPPLAQKRQEIRVVTGDNWVRVLPNGAAAPSWEGIPMECTLEAAYEGLDLDPFDSYDPFDFDFADNGSFGIESDGVDVKSRVLNKIEFEVCKPEFFLTVTGFDSNLRLLTRVTYDSKRKEVENEADNDA